MNPFVTTFVVVSALAWPGRVASPLVDPPDPDGDSTVPQALHRDALLPTLAAELFGRRDVADDAAWELDPGEPLADGRAIVGWTSRREVFEFIPMESELFPRSSYVGHEELSRLSPAAVRLVEDPSTRFVYSYGLLVTPLGSAVTYCATLSSAAHDGRVKRFVRPLASFHPADSGPFLSVLADAGGLSDTGSRFLTVPSDGVPVPRGFRGFIRTAGCVLLTAACIGVTAISVIGCTGACATLTPACVACIVGAVSVIKAVCCSACLCWKNLGSVSSCPC